MLLPSTPVVLLLLIGLARADMVVWKKQLEKVLTPQFKLRLERVQQDVPTAQTILRLLQRDPLLEQAQVVKRLLKEVDDFQQQSRSLCDHFLATPITDYMSARLINTVLLLAHDDEALYMRYMTHKEKLRLAKAIKRYRASFWPENKQALQDAVQLMAAARAMRDIIARLHDAAIDMRVSETREMARVALRRMKTICQQNTGKCSTGGTAGVDVTFGEEVDEFLLTLEPRVVLLDRDEQREQLAYILTLWDTTCWSLLDDDTTAR